MTLFTTAAAQGIGDCIMARVYISEALKKGTINEVHISHDANCIRAQKNDNIDYWHFVHGIGQLFFNTPPFKYFPCGHPFKFRAAEALISDLGIVPVKPQHEIFKPLLCQGQLIDINQEYIVITTKLRYFDRNTFNQLAPEYWQILNRLSQRYKIVLLGEREVEMCQDYRIHGSNQIYGIYNEIKQNIAPDKLMDLTIPALGITAPKLYRLQQDCLTMSEAKFVINFGIGGNFCMAMAVANLVGFRVDNENITNTIFSRSYSDAICTKDWNHFKNVLLSYL